MTQSATIELKNIDPEDISDSLIKIEKSFGLKLDTKTFEKAGTFGDICDIILGKIALEQTDDCTTQQAFYKIRQAIVNVSSYQPNEIGPNSLLEKLIHREKRRVLLKKIENETGLSLNLLRPRRWVQNTLSLGLLASLIEIFINWEFGLICLSAVICGFKIASNLGKEFRIDTIGDAAKQSARENYLKSRRNSRTVNRMEMVEKIKEIFIHDHDLDPSALRRDAVL